MRKRLFSMLLTGAMVASVFSALPSRAAHYSIPDAPNIEDPAQDANGLNDQGLAFVTGYQGDHSANVYFGGADFLKVWFSNDASKLRVHMLTSAPGPGGNFAYVYRVHVNDGCVWFQANVDGATNTAEPSTVIRDACGELEAVPGEIEVEELDDGTGLTTLTYDLGSFPGIELGGSLTTPNATSRLFAPSGHTAPQLDNTVNGTDYEIAAGGGAPKIEEPTDDPGQKDEAPVKKGCKKKKGKGKKKGCDKGKGPKEEPKAGCAAYEPGENGAEAETLMVTDSATAEEPVTVEFDAGVGMGGPVVGGVPVPPDGRTHNYHNVQIDSDSPEVGLYVRLEFTDRRDYDLYLFYPDGTEATHSGDFNTLHEALSCGGAETGCEGGSNFEQVNGIRTVDCQGWTTDSVAFLTEGGDVTLSLWLGEIQNDPAAPAS